MRKVADETQHERDTPGDSDRGGPAGREGAWLVAAAGTALEVAGLVVMAVLSLTGIATGRASTTTRAATEAVMLLVLAAAVALVVVGLWRRRSVAKTPALLWNGMLIPVAFSLFDGGAHLVGAATGVIAAVSFAAALVLPRYLPDAEDPAT